MKDPNETRTNLANAINSIVAMTDFETEQVVDAVLGVIEPDDEPDELSILEIEDLMADRLRWAHSTVSIVMCDESMEDETTNALSGACNYLEDARRYLDSLEYWRRKHHPHTRERDLTSGEQREDEKREILERLQKLPSGDAGDVLFAHGALLGADAETKAEAWKLLNRGRSVDNVRSYVYLRKEGDVQLSDSD